MNTDQQTFAAFALANEDRKKSLLQYVSEGANNADLEAAGYTPAEIAAAFPPAKQKSFTISKEFDRDRQGGAAQYAKDQGTIEPYTPTGRENLSDTVYRGVNALGISEPQRVTNAIVGNEFTGQMGVADFTPLAIPMGFQEGARQVQAGINTGSKTDVALGVANAALSAADAIPGAKVLTKMGKGALKDAAKYVPELAKASLDAIDNAMYETFGKPAQSLIPVRAGATSTKGVEKKAVDYNPTITNMFGGPSAKDYPHLMEASADIQRKAGVDPQKIWEDTGIQFLPNGRPVFQIDPAGAKVQYFDFYKKNVPQIIAKQKAAGNAPLAQINLPDILDFPELYKNYPQLKDFKVIFKEDVPEARGAMSIGGKRLTLNMDFLTNGNPEDMRSTLLHELQHGIQAVETTPGGANSSYFFERGPKGDWVTGAPDMEQDVLNYNMLEEDLRNSISEYAKKPLGTPQAELDALYDESMRKRDILAKEKQRLEDLAFNKYKENPGEVEARAAQLWAKLTPEERQKTLPSEIYFNASLGYAKLGEAPYFGDNFMPTTRLPASEEEMARKLDFDAERLSMQSEDKTTEALGTAPRNPSVDAKPKSQINPLFKPKEVQDDNLVTFYSPLKSAIDEMVIGVDGKSGRDVMAYLNKRAPNVSKGELQFSRINLDPEKKYSKEEILNSLEYTTEGTVAKFRSKKSGALYGKEQLPKNYVDKQQDYFEVTLEAKDLPGRVHTHYNDKTLAHSRTTVHTDASGEKYFIINELQSDALQNVGKKHVFAVPDPTERVVDLKAALSLDMNADYREPVFDFFTEEGMNPKLNREELVAAYKEKFGINAAGKDIATVHKDALRKAVDGLNEYDIDYFDNKVDYILKDFQTYQAELKMSEAGYQSKDIPFESTSAYVKNLLLANISRAKQDGVNKIVIPNLEEIARLRKDDFEGGIEAAKKALKPTYDNAVKKAVNMLNSEYGNRIKLGTRNIEYKDLTKKSRVRSSPSTELDVTNFEFDPSTQRVRFAEGGIVESEQMDKLMQEGGIAGSDVAREPVTGNEVPPGAMPSEVRDDVPAQLSEGEYVVPADVVRFFGVKYFEDLRMQAKQGLSDMDANGRIGGATVDSKGVPMGMEQDEELTPEEEQMLMEALGGRTGMAEGGDVPFDRTTFTLNPIGTVGTESKKYIDPATGETRVFQFSNGVSLGVIPANFVPWTQELETAAKTPKTDTKPDNNAPRNPMGSGEGADSKSSTYVPSGAISTGGGTGFGTSGAEQWAKDNAESIAADPFKFGMDALKEKAPGANTAIGASAIAGFVPGVIGGVAYREYNKVQNVAEANAALKVMEAKGLKGTDKYDALSASVDNYISNLSPLEKAVIKNDMMGTGDKYYAALTTPPGTTAATPVKPTGGNTKNVGTIGTVTGSGSGGAADRSGPVVPTKNVTASLSAGANQPSVKNTSAYGDGSGADKAAERAAETAKVSSTLEKTQQGLKVGGFKEGGLVTRTKKAPAKTKGLAGKQ